MRSAEVKVTANVSGFVAGMDRAKASAAGLSSSMKAHAGTMDKLGSVATRAGVAVGAGVGAAAKAAVDWESAWTGVAKTVDGTPAQMKRLEGQLRDLTRVLPVSHQEIAGVAEAAGQLGVKQQDVAKFTSTMVKLGTATNMTSEEAATSLRQFMNVMGTAPKDVDRLAATVVDLGNNSATTERDIVEMGQRLSGTGKQMRMSEPQVMAFGAAMASVGINAEAGGTAMSRNWIKIDRAVRSGGQSLQTMAKVSGMSAAQFKKAWQTDAAGATNALIEGLGRASKSGQDVSKLLDQMGIKGQYQTDAMKRLAGASKGAGNSQDQLAQSLQIANRGWEQNSALAQEFARRQGTTASQMQLSVNAIKDAAIDVGAAALPVLGKAAHAVSDWAKKFSALPDSTKDAILKWGAIGGAALIAAGQVSKFAGAIKVVSGAFGLVRGVGGVVGAFAGIGRNAGRAADEAGRAAGAFDRTGGKAQRATGKVGGLGRAIGGIALAWGGVAAVAQGIDSHIGDIAMSAATADTALQQLAKSSSNPALGKAGAAKVDASFSKIDKRISSMKDALTVAEQAGSSLGARTARRLDDLTNHMVGARSKMDLINEGFSNLDKQLSGLNLGAAQKAFAGLKSEMKGVDPSLVVEKFPDFKARLEAVATQLNVSGLSAQDYAAWMGGKVPAAVQIAANANEKLARSLGVIPDHKRTDLEVKVFGGSRKEIETLGREIAKLPADQQTKIRAIAKTEGFRPAMAEIADLKKQQQGIQRVTTAGVKVEVKGGSKAQLKDLTDRLNSIPKEQQYTVAAIAKAEGIDAAKAKLSEFTLYADAANNKTVVVNATAATGSAMEGFHRIEGKIAQLNGKQVLIPSRAPGAEGTVERINGVYMEWKRVAGKVIAVQTSAPGATSAKSKMDGLRRSTDATNGKHATVTARAQTGGAEAALATLSRTREATIIAKVKPVGGGAHPMRASMSANGNLFERHDAQIARAGAWRVWAEPETGGEAYIPLAAAKRPRSRMIAAETVARLGGDVTWHASGSLSGVERRHVWRTMSTPTDPFSALRAATEAEAATIRARQSASRAWWNARRRHDKRAAKLGEALNRAKDAERDATQKANEALKNLADEASRTGSEMARDYRAGGSVSDWVASMQQGSVELGRFQVQLAELRRRGLSDANVQTLTGMGVGRGSEMAAEVLRGGRSAVANLNAASARLDATARKLGMSSLARYADGGIADFVTRPRLMAEPETGGEAYIPLAAAKRARSRSIWWETGRRLGMVPTTAPSRPTSLAGGGTITVAPPVVNQTVLVDLGDLGGIVEGRTVQVLNRTARNVRRSR